jgi:hypothetical protein
MGMPTTISIGAWAGGGGMALRIQGFTGAQRRALGLSRTVIERRLAHLPCPVPRDLCEELATILTGRRPVVDLAYGGDGGGQRTPYARSAGYRILLYQRAFPLDNGGATGLAPILFHELVHIARGWELDAEAFENAWFTPAEGARPPSAEDWVLFKEQEYRGWWVRLHPRTRQVMDYADRLVVTFPRKTRRSVKP